MIRSPHRPLSASPPRGAARWFLCALAAWSVAGCNKDEIVWVEFNEGNQIIEVEVLPLGSPIGEPKELELLSNLGIVPVGTATVNPGSGPVGTSHQVSVNILDDFQDIVGRASVEVKTGAVESLDGENRGDGEYEMRRDSADVGVYAITLQSLGDDDENRTDRFTIHLWQPDQLQDIPDTTAE